MAGEFPVSSFFFGSANACFLHVYEGWDESVLSIRGNQSAVELLASPGFAKDRDDWLLSSTQVEEFHRWKTRGGTFPPG